MLNDSELVQFRSRLGTYKDKFNREICIKENPHNDFYDARHFAYTLRQGYKELKRDISYKEVLPVLDLCGVGKQFEVVSLAYPQLQKLFRDGQPITAVTLFMDSMQENIQVTGKSTDSFQWLLDNF